MTVSVAEITHAFNTLRHDICLEETEDNWEKISKAIQAFTSIAENGGYESAPAEVANAVRNFHRALTNAMNSERTRLCGIALDMLTSLANGIGHYFEQLLPLFMPTLLSISGRTNKVVINRARNAILNIIESTQTASVLPFFVPAIKDKAATLRLVVAESTLACLNSCNPPDLEKEARARDIETIIRATARDANPDVRKASRKVFESYKILLPSRVESFTAPLSPTMKKYLDIKSTTTTAKSLISSKSTSNLRERSEVPGVNPIMVKAHGHTRSASSSAIAVPNAAQSKTLAAKLTRVVRNKQPPPIQQPATALRKDSESQKADHVRPAPSTSTTKVASGPIRTLPRNAESKPASRNHPNTTSRLASTTASVAASTTAITVARRLQVTSDTQLSAVVQQPSTTSGPRRVPMPPPAPKKEQEVQKRPPSRVDPSVSTNEGGRVTSSTLARPPAPMKKEQEKRRVDPPASTNEAGKAGPSKLARPPVPVKKAATITSRAPITKPPVPKFKPTANSTTTASASTVPTTSTKTTDTRPLVINKAKPIWGRAAPASTRTAPSASQKAPAKSVVKKPSSLFSKNTVQSSASTKRPMTPAMVALPPSPPPSEPHDNKDAQETNDDRIAEVISEDVVLQAGNMLPKPCSAPEQPELNVIAEDEDGDKTIHHDSQTYTSVSVSPADSRLSTPTSEGSLPVMHISNTEKPSIHNPDLFVEDQAIPHTPESNLLLKPHDAVAVPAKTPISALLASIERGFLYSPTTPLSPADSYLPGPNGTIAYRHETHAPRVEGPMRPFNHALHVMNPGGIIFGKIGTVQDTD